MKTRTERGCLLLCSFVVANVAIQCVSASRPGRFLPGQARLSLVLARLVVQLVSGLGVWFCTAFGIFKHLQGHACARSGSWPSSVRGSVHGDTVTMSKLCGSSQLWHRYGTGKLCLCGLKCLVGRCTVLCFKIDSCCNPLRHSKSSGSWPLQSSGSGSWPLACHLKQSMRGRFLSASLAHWLGLPVLAPCHHSTQAQITG